MPLALAHRGDWSDAPENTLAAFAAAERAGADLVELDIRLTADGGLAVVHDPTLERVWGLPRAVAEVSLAEARALRAGGHRIPTLAEALDAISVGVMVDYTLADVVEPALDAIRDAGALDRCLFSGANVAGHRRIRELAPDARIALTWTQPEPPADALLDELAVEFFNPPHELVDPGVVEAMHERGTKVSTWTVDDEAEMRRVIDAGVDAVISNRIGALVALLEEARC
ncbi:MAG TPA: glycerophosphodiester phosphodiesterase family protein [Gaiellaceae bacterium]|nr:glycerophosphodiester phosphodiesterase family protein [Gaiellaceae bacterium]